MDYNRANATAITPQARQTILSYFGLQKAPLLAIGTEAEVYAYGVDKLVKLYADAERLSFFETLRQFYGNLDAGESGLTLPAIHEIHHHDNLIAIVESRLPGVTLESLLPAQPNAERLYLDALWQLKQIKITLPPKTYLLFDRDGSSDTSAQRFDAFYADLLVGKLPQVSQHFARYDPQFAEKATQLVKAIRAHHTEQLHVIHGDFFPGNLLVDPVLNQVYGVIDFGAFTMFGNYLVDVAGAFSFYRMYGSERHSIRQRMLDAIMGRLNDGEKPQFFQYLLANAILTADLYAPPEKLHNDGHFQWAVEIVTTDYYWQQALV